MKTIIFLIILVPGFLFAQVITDTLWSVPQLDGEIGYRPYSGTFGMNTGSTFLRAGDGYDPFMMENVFVRSYLSYDLSNLPSLDSTNIIQAIVGVYQFRSFGNEQPNVFPIWNVAGGDTHFCVLDHIDYGYSLDLSDWTAGDPGDPQTLHTKIGVISDNANYEYKTMDVTNFVREDIQNGKYYNQYRMRFTIDTDNDIYSDALTMHSGNSYSSPMPFLKVQYDTTHSTIEKTGEVISYFNLSQNYPNPFNSFTNISYSLMRKSFVCLTIIDPNGKIIEILIEDMKPAGRYIVQFDASDLPSGIYSYRLKVNRQSITKKMFYIR